MLHPACSYPVRFPVTRSAGDRAVRRTRGLVNPLASRQTQAKSAPSAAWAVASQYPIAEIFHESANLLHAEALLVDFAGMAPGTRFASSGSCCPVPCGFGNSGPKGRDWLMATRSR